jgi:hypothetical protein
MAINTTFSATGTDRTQETRIHTAIATALGPRAGDWQISFVGSQSNLIWEMRVASPNGSFVRNLDPANGEHEPHGIAEIVTAFAVE